MDIENSYNDIQSIQEDWQLDERNGLPYSGQSVQRFIKEMLNSKIQASYFDPSTYILYSFRNEEDKLNWLETQDNQLVLSQTPFTFTGVINQLKVINGMDSTNLYYITTTPEAVIKMSFVSQQKGLTDTTWEEILEDFNVTVSVDKGYTGSFTNILENQLVLNGKEFSVDVKKYIANGSNRVRISVEGVTTGTTTSIIYNVTLTSMYLEASNFGWHVPFVEGNTYNLGGVLIGGSLNKVLNVRVTGDDYDKLYQVNLGTATYTTNSYYFTGMEFPGQTGVYHVECWLDADGLESDHLQYDIMCVSSVEILTAKLLVINEVSEVATNFTDNILYKYSCYNGGSSIASPKVLIKANNQTLIDETLIDVTAMSKQSYVTNLEIESEDTNMVLFAEMEYGVKAEAHMNIDNSASYPATSGASFYLNASARNNSQENYNKIVNQVNGTEYYVDWSGMAWTEKSDGWVLDDTGRKSLYIPAGSKADISYQPLKDIGTGKTIEFLFKASNVSDSDEPIITICDDPTSTKFKGIRITPSRITVHSRDLNTADSIQGYTLEEDKVMHVIVTIVRNYKTTYGNFCLVYVNGVKKCTFTFESADNWNVNSNLILGSETADLFMYKMRTYEVGFGMQDAMDNFVSSSPSATEKKAAMDEIKSVIDDSYNIDYSKIVGKKNTMVVEMLKGAELPHYGLNKEYEAKSNVWVDILNEIEELVQKYGKLSGEYLNQTVSGQGTTSMNYWIWNLRWKKTPIRMTAKKNFASSMQDHKMGATSAYNDLHDYVIGPNEAGSRTAVYQYPVYGFQKVLVDGTEDQYIYKFIGLYTIGPDKGDKATFAISGDYKKTLMYMEGTDHSIKGVGMEYPYSEMKYIHDEECLCADRGNGMWDAAWEVSASPYETEEEIQQYLDQEFKPAYEVAYNNSTMIIGTDMSIEDINSDVEAWGLRKDKDGHAYQRFNFWIDGEYDQYYLNIKTNKYEKDGINLLQQLGLSEEDIVGKSIEEKNELFKTLRRSRFKAEMGNYWHLDDCLFCYIFLLFFGATDNFKKNSYPYKFQKLSDGGRWRWRQDDLDTIFDIDNQGHSSKHYSIEAHDWTDDSKTAYVFKGEDSVFWRLLDECFDSELKDMGQRVLKGMYDLSQIGSTTIDRMVGFVQQYFWDKAQNYFTKSAYNVDAELCYEDSYPKYKDGSYDVDVNPLEQSMGSHDEAERAWVENRLVYLMSKYGFGPFKEYTDTCLGRINFRTQLAQSFTLTPALDMFPTILSGQGSVNTSTTKVKMGEEVRLEGAGGTNTNVYIMAADYMRSLGDLSSLTVDASTNAAISVASKRLQEIKVGDENAEKVTSNLQTIAVGNCPSVSVIDARNLKSLTGAVDLSNCPRLKKALFGGTDVRSITLADGSKITQLQLPDSVTVLTLQNLKFLSKEGFEYGELGNVEFFRIENCEQLKPFEILKSIYHSEHNNLRDLRVVGFVYDGSALDTDMLANMANDLDKDGNYHQYNGIDAEGNPMTSMLPVIEGTINIDGSIYEDSEKSIRKSYPNLILNVSKGYYVRFKDAEVQRIVSPAWGDGIGVREDELAEVTSIGNMFTGNENIVNFEELERCTSLERIGQNAFEGCTNLTNVNLPHSIKQIGGYAFKNISNLRMSLPENIEVLGTQCFSGSGIGGDINLPRLNKIEGNGTFNATKIESISNLGTITGWGDSTITATGFASNCQHLTTVQLPETLTTIGGYSFASDHNLRSIYVPSSIETIGQNAFNDCENLAMELELPNLTKIDRYAFRNSGLKTFNDMGWLTVIDNYTFDGCKQLTHMNLPHTLEAINQYAFRNCSNLKIDGLPEALKSIGQNAFEGCTSMEFDSINLPNLEEFGVRAFSGVKIRSIENLGQITSLPSAYSYSQNYGDASVLESINIPSHINIIPAYSFSNYSNLKSINMGTNIVSIGDNAFEGCMNWEIDDVNFPGLQNLGQFSFRKTPIKSISDLGEIAIVANYTFEGCENLETVNLSDKIKTIGTHAFNGCKNLTNINLEKIEVFGSAAFGDCEKLVFEDLRLPNLLSYGSEVFNIAKITKISDLGSITTLPSGGISSNNFGDKNTLEEIVLPSTLTTIPTGCFYGYKRLMNINLDHVKELGKNALRDCLSLRFEDLQLPNLEKLHEDAFYGVKITKISNLGNITELPTGTASNHTYGDRTVLTEIIIPEHIKKIPAYFMYNYKELMVCNINSNIESIGANAFQYCSKFIIEDLNLPNLTELGAMAFYDVGVKKVSSLGSITKLLSKTGAAGGGTFMRCTELESINWPSTLTEIGHSTCQNCSKLQSTIFPESLLTIGNEAFQFCTSTSIMVAPKVTNIGGNAFNSCQNLQYVYLGDQVNSIGENAFTNCPNIVAIVCNNTDIPNIAFNTFAVGKYQIYVPDSIIEEYKNATNWSEFGDCFVGLSRLEIDHPDFYQQINQYL